MAVTPWLAAGGQFLASKFEQHDVRSLLPVESEVFVCSDFCFLLRLQCYILCNFGQMHAKAPSVCHISSLTCHVEYKFQLNA